MGISYYIKNPSYALERFIVKFGHNWMPDKLYLGTIYRLRFHHKLNWKNPQGFNEKLNWLKVYDRNPIYTQMADKYDVKQYVASRIGGVCC